MKIKIPLTCTIEVEDGASGEDIEEIMNKEEIADVLITNLNDENDSKDMFLDTLEMICPVAILGCRFNSPLVKDA